MAVRAVVFDTGDVLEIIGPASWTGAWCREFGLTQAEFDAAADRVDPATMGLVLSRYAPTP